MRRKFWKLLLAAAIVCCAAVGLAQVTGFGKPVGDPSPVSAAAENEGEDLRKKTTDDPWHELERIYQLFGRGGSLEYAGMLRLTNEDGSKILENAPFSGEVAGNDFRYSIDSVDLVQKNGLSLNVYHREQLVIAGSGPQSSGNLWAYANIDSLKAMANREGTTAEVLQDGGSKVIKIGSLNGSDVYGYEIYYNPADYKLQKTVLHLATLDDLSEDEEQDSEADVKAVASEEETESLDSLRSGPSLEFNLYRMEVNYTRLQAMEKRTDFDPVRKYAQVEKNSLLLNDAYRDYRVVWIGQPEKKHKR